MKRYQSVYVFVLLVSSAFLMSCRTPHQISVNHHNDQTINSNASDYKLFSDKLGVDFNGTEDPSLLQCLSEWMGVPYKYGGFSKQGTDCSGMVMSVFEEVYNLKLFRSSAGQLKNVREIHKNELKTGDLVFFKINNDSVSHVGIYLGENKFIHATTRKGVMVDDLDEDYYKKYYYTSGRVNMPR